MRKILIALLCLVSCSVFGQRITDKLERVGFLELRANGPLHLPEDTVLSTSVNADICQQIAKKDGVVYHYDCVKEYWRPIAPENALDSARRSNDTLYFRTFAGTEFAVKMDYYDKGQADARYKPIGYAPAWVEITDKPATFPPSAHQHPISEVNGLQTELDSKIPVAEKAAANGVATLGSNGKIPSNQIPALAISETFVVASQASMLGLTAETGDVAVRTDLSKSFILSAEPPSTLSNWQELLTPTAPVQSVNGQTGNVVITKTDVGLGNVDNTSDANKPISTATQTALNGKEPTISGGLPTQYWTGSKAWADFTQSARDAFSAGSGISISNGVITNTAPAPATPSWQQTLAVNNIATITPAVVNAPPLDAGLYAVGQYELRSSTYPSIGFHRPGNAGMALYLGDIDQADLRIRTSSNTDYKIWHDGYAPVPTPTLQQVTTAGNTTNETVVIGNHILGTSRALINNAPDDGITALQVGGSVRATEGLIARNLFTDGTLAMQVLGTGENRISSGNGPFSAWKPLQLASGGLLVSNNSGGLPAYDGVSALQINGATKGTRFISTAANGLQLINSAGYIEAYDDALTARTGYLQFNSGTSIILSADGNFPITINTGGAERMRVSGNGNVGIGTTNAFNPLSLPNNRYIGWNNVAGTNDEAGIKGDAANNMVFYAEGERMTIQASTGNVGIGTNNPTHSLSVAGSASFTNGLFTVSGLGQANIAGTMEVGGTITAYTGIDLPAPASLRIQDGAAAGKVLTSDANGFMSLQYPASGNYVNLNASDFTGPQTGYVYVTGNIRTQAQVNSAGIISTNGISSTTANNAQISITNSTAGVSAGIFVGTGSPENVVNAQPGSLFLSSSGTLYLKTSGTGNTGWVAK